LAEEEKFKTPEELGRAVGEKIEALFGGIFDEPAPKPPTTPQDVAAARSPAVTQTIKPPTKPQPARTPAPGAAPTPKAPTTVTPKVPPAPSSITTLLDRIEAVALNLEWESKSSGARELEQRFRDIARFLPKEGPARNIAGMNYRVLQLYGRPGSSPHPMLGKFLQDSCAALRQISDPQGGRIPDRELMTGIVDAYHKIMREAAQTSGHVAVPEKPVEGPTPEAADIGTAIASLEDVKRRLGRLAAAAAKREGGLSSADALSALKALEKAFGGQLERLSSLLAQGSGTVQSVQKPSTDGRVHEGFILLDCHKSPIAAPASFVAAMYPLDKSQAEQFASKSAINLGNRRVPRLPLKRPKEGEPRILPNWLIHLVSGEKEYFLLAERCHGYRRAPQGFDPSKDTKVKFGSVTYYLLTGAVFR
jgi:hypothetical protein